MKYLKTFEGAALNYDLGDCVKIKKIPDNTIGIERISDNLFVKIMTIDHYSGGGKDTYYIQFETLITKQKISGYKSLISRKMTKKEIDYCKMKSETNKFNL